VPHLLLLKLAERFCRIYGSIIRRLQVHYEKCRNLQQPLTSLCCTGAVSCLAAATSIKRHGPHLSRTRHESAPHPYLPWEELCCGALSLVVRSLGFSTGLLIRLDILALYTDSTGALGCMCTAARDLWCGLRVLVLVRYNGALQQGNAWAGVAFPAPDAVA